MALSHADACPKTPHIEIGLGLISYSKLGLFNFFSKHHTQSLKKNLKKNSAKKMSEKFRENSAFRPPAHKRKVRNSAKKGGLIHLIYY